LVLGCMSGPREFGILSCFFFNSFDIVLLCVLRLCLCLCLCLYIYIHSMEKKIR